MHGLYVCDCGAVADCTGSTVCCDTECIPLSTKAEWRQSAVDYGCVDDRLLLLYSKDDGDRGKIIVEGWFPSEKAGNEREKGEGKGQRRQKTKGRAERCAYDGKRKYQRIDRKGRSTMDEGANKPRVGCVRKWKCL